MRKGLPSTTFDRPTKSSAGFIQHHFLRKSGAGFTLIETIIYAALFSTIIGLVLGAVYQIVDGSGALEKSINTDAEAQFLTRKIEWALGSISVVNLPVSGSTGATLSVNKLNYAQNPIIFDLDSNNLRIKEGASNPVILNSSNVTISNLQFQHLAAGTYRPAAIQFSFKVNGDNYSTTIYLRK